MNNHSKSTIVACFSVIVASLLIIFFLAKSPQSLIGNVILEDTIIKEEFVFDEQQVATRSMALNSLIETESQLIELSRINLSGYYFQDKRLEADLAFIGKNTSQLESDLNTIESQTTIDYLQHLLDTAQTTISNDHVEQNYTEVIRLTQLITFRTRQALDVYDNLDLLSAKEQEYLRNNIDITDASKLLSETRVSFDQQRYNEAQAYLKETSIKFDQALAEQKRTKGLLNLSKSFFERFWKEILILIISLVIIGIILYKRIRIWRIKRKIISYAKELKSIRRLMKRAQRDCYQHLKISEETYRLRMDHYQRRRAKIKRTIPVLKAIIHQKRKNGPKRKRSQGALVIKR